MHRRNFIHAGLAMTAASVIAGCVGDEPATADNPNTDEQDTAENGFPSYDVPLHGEWIPTESQDPEATGVYFTHIDWDAITALDDDEDPEGDEDVSDAVEHLPIIGLPLYGALISPLAVFGIMFYPFAEGVLPEEGEEVDGVETTAMTWTDDTLIFHGTYDQEVFEAQYAEDFTATDERNGFTIFLGEDFADGMAYAVAEDTLVVGMESGEEADYTPEEVVIGAIDRRIDEVDRVVDADDGTWLFETTGDAQMAFGTWETDDLGEALDTDEEVDTDEEGAEDDSDIDDNPVFDDVESLVNNLVYDVEDGEMVDLEARFAAIYPDDAVPSEDEVVEYLVGDESVPHEIHIDGNRVHAIASFDERPDDPETI